MLPVISAGSIVPQHVVPLMCQATSIAGAKELAG